ncbi:Ribonuclease P protein component [Rubrivivax sp. A210]|uniref:ribonuclease P protein component n=1 Tax=Rubrivivax sp. A210 TaxID=2772301 RepID=UPI00191A771F|nr:ribonuclease P protein component [Rubrivivax sp. A210]CAD5373426.1 Ribonuclease P protein component [Rubrivivax sp. A210]
MTLPDRATPGRLVHKADFERLLATRSRMRSAHFAIHHVAGVPVPPPQWVAKAGGEELSTGAAPICPQPVDDSPGGLWFGCVVPKRHARRAVTRNLLKRQIRGALHRHAAALADGLWLVRLRAGFPTTEFISARSAALAAAAASELDGLLGRGGR